MDDGYGWDETHVYTQKYTPVDEILAKPATTTTRKAQGKALQRNGARREIDVALPALYSGDDRR